MTTSVAVALTTALAAGCSQSTPADSTYKLPDLIRYNNVWSAASGIDLTAPEVVVARAFFESRDISMQAGTQAAYPGYEAKLSSLHAPDAPRSLFYFAPPQDPTPVYGTRYWRVMEIEQKPDAWRITACAWENGLSYPDGDHFRTTTSMYLTPSAQWVELRAPWGEERTSPGTGPARYPTTDVFGAWKFHNADLSADHRFVEQCSALPDNPVPPELRTTDQKKFDKPLPAEPPVPGWPDI